MPSIGNSQCAGLFWQLSHIMCLWSPAIRVRRAVTKSIRMSFCIIQSSLHWHFRTDGAVVVGALTKSFAWKHCCATISTQIDVIMNFVVLDNFASSTCMHIENVPSFWPQIQHYIIQLRTRDGKLFRPANCRHSSTIPVEIGFAKPNDIPKSLRQAGGETLSTHVK